MSTEVIQGIRKKYGNAAKASSSGALHELLTSVIAGNVRHELALMEGVLGKNADARALQTLRTAMMGSLQRIGALVENNRIAPWFRVRHALADPEAAPLWRPIRVGVFPTAGNPLHWMHLLSGLKAIEQFRLDKVIFIIAGSDPRKQDLAPEAFRHLMGRDVVKLFSPFFEYSPLSLGSARPGEESLFKLFAMNTGVPLHAFYLVGSDHYHRFNTVTGDIDTIERLEENVQDGLFGYNPHMHKLSVVFVARNRQYRKIQSFLDIRWIERLPLHTSSTKIRAALQSQCTRRELNALPFTAYSSICAHGTYGQERVQEHARRAPRRVSPEPFGEPFGGLSALGFRG